MSDHLKLKVNKEDSFFAKKEQEQIRDLREKAAQDNSQKYQDEHKYHCFRCGTKSLVEIQKGKVSIDLCVNEKCGALHLDAGELDALFKDQSFVKMREKASLIFLNNLPRTVPENLQRALGYFLDCFRLP